MDKEKIDWKIWIGFIFNIDNLEPETILFLSFRYFDTSMLKIKGPFRFVRYFHP